MRAKPIVRWSLVWLLTHGVALGATPAARPATQEPNGKARTLDVRMSGSAGLAPATLRWAVFVDVHEDNRLLRVSLDGDDFFQSSDVQLDGTQSPRTHFVSWRDIPAGEYVVTAVLYGSTGPRATLVRNFTVIGH